MSTASSAASGFFAADTRFLSRSVLTIDGDRGEPVALRAERAARRGLRAGVGDRVGGAARAVRRSRPRRGGNCLEPVRPRGGSGARARARLRLRRHLRGQARRGPRRAGHSEVAPSRPEHWQDARTVEFADEGFPARTLVHLAPAPDEADGGAARYRLRLAPGERWQLGVAVQWLLNGDAGARRCRVRGGAARRSTRAGRVARCLVALGAAAAGARRTLRSSGPGRSRSPTWPRSGCAGRGAGWCRRQGCRGS